MATATTSVVCFLTEQADLVWILDVAHRAINHGHAIVNESVIRQDWIDEIVLGERVDRVENDGADGYGPLSRLALASPA